jgi:peptide/nickel transport system ATP-binding protein
MQVLDANQDRVKPSRLPSSLPEELLRVCDLSVSFRSSAQPEARVVRKISFAIARREIVGLLGESGSGKSTTASAILQILLSSAYVVGGSIEFDGESLLALHTRRLREIRGSEVSIVYQNSDVLNPVMRVGDQVIEVLRAHKRLTIAQMRDEVYSLFAAMGLSDCERIFRAYPHQLSGGQRRRIAIAQALVCKPRLVIADEPSAWLDSNTTSEILNLFTRFRDLYDTAFLLISHDPKALSIVDRVLVMYAGQIVESGPVDEVFAEPKHPYTQALLRCSPTFSVQGVGSSNRRLPSIPGQAPDPTELLPGCSFAGRCGDRMEICDSRPPELIEISAGSTVRCLKYEERD